MISSLHAFLYSWAWFRVRVWDHAGFATGTSKELRKKLSHRGSVPAVQGLNKGETLEASDHGSNHAFARRGSVDSRRQDQAIGTLCWSSSQEAANCRCAQLRRGDRGGEVASVTSSERRRWGSAQELSRSSQPSANHAGSSQQFVAASAAVPGDCMVRRTQ